MPPPPKRKWRRPQGDRVNGAASGSSTPTTPRSTVAQQPKRPKVDDAIAPGEGAIGIVNVKQMYSTAAGDAQAKPFSALSGTLDKALLDGLDKMGFE
jgi:ATP-dependent RNA helicase MSS116